MMLFVLLIGGCELRFQDPFSHPAGNTDTDIFDDDSDDGGPPYGGVISFRTITVNGIRDDWDGVTSIIDDAAGDSTYSGAGGDIVSVRLAADDTFLYFGIDLADDTPSTTQEFGYKVWIQDPGSYYISGILVGNVEITVNYDGANWSANALTWDGTNWVPISGFDSAWGAAGSPTGLVEMQIQRSMVIQKTDLLFRGYLHGNTLPEDPDATERWLYTLP
ncbi:MAG: hypothetical protein PF508_19365 [Spirochaeta sp.]|jgi:hypothetical protein|nr:hypothetical protein [Spirochaeta sp.]